MIEETHPNDDSYIVRVKAVVMTRDDSSGGWLAQDGGALSRVGVCRVPPPEPILPAGRTRFLIHGERLLDRQVILECQLRKDLVYTKPTPTFHHWKVEERKFGLTFQSPADARAFDRGVRKAVEDMTEGSTTSSSTLQNEAELGDDDVFTNATDSSSNSSQRLESSLQSSPRPHRHNCVLDHRHDLHDPNRLSDHYFLDQSLPRLPRHVTFQEEEEIVRINPRERIWEQSEEYHPGHHLDHSWLTGYEDYRHATVRDKFIQPDDSESYVHFAKSEPHKHDYTYPLAPAELLDSDSLDPSLRPFAHKDDSSHHHHVFSVVSSQPRSLLPGSSPGDKGQKAAAGDRQRLRCRYCGELFVRGDNRRGQCQDAPDPIRACVHRASCMWLADTMLYHCMSDPEGDYSDPCSCGGGDGGGEGDGDGGQLGPRWAALLGLSLVAPCLCLYPPLHACHWVGVACGCCGGRHKATG